jgi:hypothetical protein
VLVVHMGGLVDKLQRLVLLSNVSFTAVLEQHGVWKGMYIIPLDPVPLCRTGGRLDMEWKKSPLENDGSDLGSILETKGSTSRGTLSIAVPCKRRQTNGSLVLKRGFVSHLPRLSTR